MTDNITRVAIICDYCDEAFGLSVEPISPTVMDALVECINPACGGMFELNETNHISKAGIDKPLAVGESV